jgi:hypothetical protein
MARVSAFGPILAILLAVAAAAKDLPPELAGLEAEGEKWFHTAGNTDLSASDRNEARKKAWVNLYRAKEILDAHWEENPGDQDRLEDRMVKVGQMVFWLKKESPMGLLEGTGVGPKAAAPAKPREGWGSPPPPEKPGGAPAAPGAPPAAPGAPAAPARPPIEDAFKAAEAYARKHRADGPGILGLYQRIVIDYADQPSHRLLLEAARRAGEISAKLKDVYRRLRNDDPDSLKDVDGEEVRRTAIALGREITSPDPEVRRRAGELLGALGSGEGVFPLAAAAQREKEPALAAAFLDGIVRIGGRKAIDQLGKLRDDDLGPKALEALGTIAARGPVERRFAALEISDFVLAQDDALSGRATDALIALGSDGLAGLVKALDTKRTELRLKLIPAIGSLKDPASAKPLARFLLLGDNPNTVACRNAASEAIKALGEPCVPHLFAGLRDPGTKMHTGAILRELTGQVFSSSRPGDWIAWYKRTHPEWKPEKE